MPNVSFQAPNEYSVEQADIERRRKYAEALQAQSMQAPETQTAGGWAIKNSPLQGLGRLAQAYAARRGQDRASEEQKALGERYTAEHQKAWADALRAGEGTPARTILPDPQEAEQSADQGAPTVPTVQQAAIPPNRAALIAALTGSKFPDMRQMGMTQQLEDMKPRVVGKSLLNGTGGLIGSDPTFAAEQEATRVDRGEQAAAQRVEAERRQKADQEFKAQQADAARIAREDMIRVAASLRPPRPEPAVQPLVPISDGQGGSVLVERKDAVGKTPAVAGSKLEAKEAGKADVDKDVVKLKGMLDDLRAGGGITDTAKGAASNVGASVSASGVGQFLGGAVGSKNQSSRNELLMIRPSLLRSIMSSTGMSAKQMDSNAELKLWLSTATDPSKDYQANIQALNNIAAKYGSGGFLDDPAPMPKRRASDRVPDEPPVGAVRRLP